MEKFEVFISFKNTDKNGERTEDSRMAEELYYALRNRGIHAFYSNVSIAEKGEHDFGNMINDALEQADIFVAVGTSLENLSSRWVKYELECFNGEMLNGNKVQEKSAMYSYITPNVSVNKLPMALRRCQSFTDLDAVVSSVQKRISGRENVRESFSKRPQQRSIGEGTVFVNRYRVVKKIGSGGFSDVYLATDIRLNTPCALKVSVKKGTVDFHIFRAGMMAEIAMLKRLDHPHLPRIIDLIDGPESFVVIMDYIPGCTLDNDLAMNGTFDEAKALRVMRQMCDVLGYLHSQTPAIIFRDIKPANIMLKPNGDITLIDFGIAREYKEDSLADTTVLGTVGYAAPEQYGGMGQTDARTDIYGLGVTIHHLLTGLDPRRDMAAAGVADRNIRAYRPELSYGLAYIIQKCTYKDPELRYQTIGAVLKDLNRIRKLSEHLRRKERLGKLFGFPKRGAAGAVRSSAQTLPAVKESRPLPPPPARSPVPIPVPVKPATNATGADFVTTILGASTASRVQACVACLGSGTLRTEASLVFFLVTQENRDGVLEMVRSSRSGQTHFASSDLFVLEEPDDVTIRLTSGELLMSTHTLTVSLRHDRATVTAIRSSARSREECAVLNAEVLCAGRVVTRIHMELKI